MAKKNYTWKFEEELVSKIQQLAEKEHRSLTNYIEVMFIEKSQSVAVGANCWPERGRQAASGWGGAAWICGLQGRPACGSANST